MQKLNNSDLSIVSASSHFSRSRFKLDHDHLTTFNVGELIPIYCQDVLPGDTFNLSTSCLIRTTSPFMVPPVGNIVFDLYYFYVPYRILWEHLKELFGENNTSAWEQTTSYSIPQTTAPLGGWTEGTIADYLGIPTKVDNISVSSLPFRAYCKIYNYWFRNENICDPVFVSFGDATTAGSNGSNGVTDAEKGGKPLKAKKFNDYFVTCLPDPQKGPDVLLPLGDIRLEDVPVFATNARNNKFTDPYRIPTDLSVAPVSYSKLLPDHSWEPISSGYNQGFSIGATAWRSPVDTSANRYASAGKAEDFSSNNFGRITPDNLVASGFASSMSSTTINQLRFAFQLQKIYERDARCGTRYSEYLKGCFGVTSPDSRLQNPEYLSGNRIKINTTQVTQTSATSGSSVLGSQGAFSLTLDSQENFTKSFTEHGIVMGIGVVRYEHSYQQGLAKSFTRKDRLDFYDPLLAHIGEQPVLYKEIYCTDDNVQNNNVFGFQPAFQDLRTSQNRISGLMRSNATDSLDIWHFADYYNSTPYLSQGWIEENSQGLDRCLAVPSTTTPSFIGDFYFNNIATRIVSGTGTPGYIDH